jgi:hypothetical protein
MHRDNFTFIYSYIRLAAIIAWSDNVGSTDSILYEFRMMNTDKNVITVEPSYKDIGLYGTSPTGSGILWYQFVTVKHNIILLGFKDTCL